MEMIAHVIAELLRPVIALSVNGIVWLLSAPIKFVGFLLHKVNNGLSIKDALRVSRFHENNSHQERKWKTCPECVEFIGLVKSARAIADSVADDAMDVEMSRLHKQNSHQVASWGGCRECRDYVEQSSAALRPALIQTTSEGIAEAVMSRFHMQSIHRELSWTDCRECVDYIEQMGVGPLDRIIPPRT